MDRKLSFNEVIGATFALMASDLPMVLGAIAVIAAASTLLDIASVTLSNFLAIPVLVAQYYLIRRLIERQGLQTAERMGGFGWFFLLGIVTSLGIGLGLVLLILPGIYLSARWSMANAALIAENQGLGQAMARSWEASRDHVLPIALTWALITLPLIAGGLALGGVGAMTERAGGSVQVSIVVLDAVSNLLLYASQVAGWYFGVALYQLLAAPAETRLDEVFA
jgi:hypothetical protein